MNNLESIKRILKNRQAKIKRKYHSRRKLMEYINSNPSPDNLPVRFIKMKIPALRAFIEMYCLMIEEGKIKKDGAGHKRLLDLKKELKRKTSIEKPFMFKSLNNWIFDYRPDNYEKKSKN